MMGVKKPSFLINLKITVGVLFMGIAIYFLSPYITPILAEYYMEILNSGIIERAYEGLSGNKEMDVVTFFVFDTIVRGIFSLWVVEYAALLWLFWQYVDLSVTKYVFEERSVEITTGVFHRQTDMVEYAKIKDIEIESPFWLRIFGMGNIYIISQDASGDVFAKRGYSASQLKKIKESVRFANDASQHLAVTIKMLAGIKNYIDVSKELKKIILVPGAQQNVY